MRKLELKGIHILSLLVSEIKHSNTILNFIYYIHFSTCDVDQVHKLFIIDDNKSRYHKQIILRTSPTIYGP